jgi:hypothetical protein
MSAHNVWRCRAIRFAAWLSVTSVTIGGSAAVAGCGSGNGLTSQGINNAINNNHAWGIDTDETGVGMVAPDSAFIPGPRRAITLLSAALIPLKGYRLPHLVNTGVVQGCVNADGNYYMYPRQTWPPIVYLGHHTVSLAPLPGDLVRTGGTKCIPLVVYEVDSRKPGPYAVAGLRIVFRAGSHTETVATYDEGIFVWFYQTGPPAWRRVNNLFHKAVKAQNAMARR